MSKICYKCNGLQAATLTEMFGYTICEDCVKGLGLFSDKTIKRHSERHETDPGLRNYDDEIKFRLDFIEKKYISSKIKLLHILERLELLK